MNKFENVDVLASLQQIMQQNTAAFQNDFDIDKKILTQAAKSKNAEDKVYLWFSRPNGTHCLRERDVFLRGTREHNTFRFYHEQTKEDVYKRQALPVEPIPVRPLVLNATDTQGRIKEITEHLEQGVQEVFESERYRDYLKAMSLSLIHISHCPHDRPAQKGWARRGQVFRTRAGTAADTEYQ